MKWVAGFETARVHWNGLDMAEQTRHTPDTAMHENYAWARAQGFTAARDGLAWHRPMRERIACVPDGFPVAWSLHHFGPPPPDPVAHARAALDLLPGRPTIIPVVEPSVGFGVSGMHAHEATGMAVEMIRAMEGRADVFTGDPMHELTPWAWEATDIQVSTGAVTRIGVHCYAHHLAVPLGDVIRAARARYGLPVVIGETGLHEGHPGNEGRPHGCRTRAEWIAYVEREATEAGAEWAAWMPVLPCNWDGGDPWPSSWPELEAAA